VVPGFSPSPSLVHARAPLSSQTHPRASSLAKAQKALKTKLMLMLTFQTLASASAIASVSVVVPLAGGVGVGMMWEVGHWAAGCERRNVMLIGVGKGEPFCAGNTNTRVAT
jgi:hypothetical protein